MTEAEWLVATDPHPMLDSQQGNTSNRKCRLVTVACYQRIWHLIDTDTKQSIDRTEMQADGLAAETIVLKDHHRIDAHGAAWGAIQRGQYEVVTHVGYQWANSERYPARRCEARAQSDLLRDIFGNPFRPVAVDPAWLTSTVVGLAHGIYDDKAFDRLPILADALQDAGCEDADLLTHCRGSGPHVRGCWVVDLLTGRT